MDNLKEELKKELEIEIEKEILSENIEKIKKEILKYIQKRNEVEKNIIKYRKQILEDYEDDEDKIIEYFDHEKYLIEQSYRTIDKKLREMTISKESPYFGKIEYEDKEYKDIENFHIGRFGITLEGSYEPLVIDWRAPVSALFYAGKLGEAYYDAPLGKVNVDIKNKTQYIIKKEKLLGMFNSELDIKDDVLQMVLSKNAGEKLKDIVMTIQKEQDEIIRAPLGDTVVVDGVAGSGKTTIALHRVAYLLYNYREKLENRTLILGPNDIFMEYISTVLPSLGETGVQQASFKDFVENLIGYYDTMNLKDYMENIINNDEKFIEDIKRKNSYKFKEELDEFIQELEKDYFKYKDVNFMGKIIVNKSEISELFNKYYKYMPLFKRSKKVKLILFSKIKDARDERVRKIQKEYEDTIKNLTKEELKLKLNNLNFQRKIKIREVIREVIQTKKELSWLNNPNCIDLYKNFIEKDYLIIDDLAPILYLKIKLEELKMESNIRHVVIDEAQDLGYLQFLVIKQLTKCKSMTIVGDSNQRLIPNQGDLALNNLNKVINDLNIKKYNLDKSYRSTKEIMEYANRYLENHEIVPFVRSGEKVKEEKFKNDEELQKLILKCIENMEKQYESIAIICKDEETTKRVSRLIKEKTHVTTFLDDNMLYKGGTIVIPSYLSKGLEFDGVILIEEDKDFSNNEKRLRYVMATRALHELVQLKNSNI